MDNLVINFNEGIKQISNIQFGMLSSSDITKLSSIELVNSRLYNETRTEIIPHGALDLRLGISQKGKICQTCHKGSECPGHFGFVKLAMPIFHIGYIKHIVNVLSCICKECSRILLSNTLKEKFKKKLLKKNYSNDLFKNIVKECKKVKECHYCKALNGSIKILKGTPTTILHDINNPKLDKCIKEKNREKYEIASELYKEVNSALDSLYEDMTPNKVYSIFKRITGEDLLYFDMSPNHSHPIDCLVTHVIVPPSTIRPTVQVNYSTTNEDDLTVKICEIIEMNKELKKIIHEGTGSDQLFNKLALLQAYHAYYINSDTKALPKNLLGNTKIRALCQRIKGKDGRFRENLSGKRVDFSARTVITPDPNLSIDQVGIPELIAKQLTYPQRVFDHNIDEMRKMIINGPEIHPGANFVEDLQGNKTFLQYTNRKKMADELKVGYIVERHLINDDIVLFNRQPSLHRMSIMGFRSKIFPWRTFSFNECVCTPFNADFDGDEMNVHLPQTEEAKAEALYLMGVKQNLISPKSAEPLVAATQDFLTTFYLITQRDFFIDRSHFFQYLSYFNNANEKLDIPPPCIIKPIELWSGKQLFSSLLRPNRYSKVLINVELKEKTYSQKGEFMCYKDGYVLIKNSELLTGNLCKASIGSGSKSGVIFALIKDNNTHITSEVLVRISKFAARWLGTYGMSFGIGDVTPFEQLTIEKAKLISSANEICENQIRLYNAGTIELRPGCNADQTLESNISKELNTVRDKAGSILTQRLEKTNSALIMSQSGSKGNNINLSQMIACVGQQIVSGNRMPNGFFSRTLPHFELNSKYPKSKGFVENSFFTGLTASEFFFHTMGGREGLIDTAVKTAETGYMQRRLVKALEDLTTQYDYSVTNSFYDILQFKYGDDRIDPMNMDDGNKVVNLKRVYNNVKTLYPDRDRNDPLNTFLSSQDIMEIVEKEINFCPIISFVNEKFKKELYDFFDDKIKYVEKLELSLISKSKGVNHSDINQFVNGICSFTYKQITEFFKTVWKKYQKAMVVPGEAVGAVAAQSIGEPGTQMTLKTFHFAGVASMNITLGVPRIKEIINGTKDIATPIITAHVINNKDSILVKIVKGRVEKTKLCDILVYIKELVSPGGCYLILKLDLDTISDMKLEITAEDVKNSILNAKKIKLKEKNIIIEKHNKIRIEPYDAKENVYFIIQILKKKLETVIVSGISSVSRAVINKLEDNPPCYNLLIEGNGLMEIMATPGVDHTRCKSNDIMEVEKVFGIEAARNTIISEIKFTMGEHGITVDSRHLQLLSDFMTFKGKVNGITRFGISKFKESTLMLASFESTTDILFDAAFHTRNDVIKGISESIITGKMIPLGTGIMKLMYDPKAHNEYKYKNSNYCETQDILEKKLRDKNMSKSKYNDIFNSNMVDLLV